MESVEGGREGMSEIAVERLVCERETSVIKRRT